VTVKLNFINESNGINNLSVVIFQKNIATDFDELSVAWRVIRRCGPGDSHPFDFPIEFTVGAADSYGDCTPQHPAELGQLFSIERTSSGDRLVLKGPSPNSDEVQLLNNLPKDAMTANVYKSGKLLATKTSLAPQQKAVFQFKPTIWVGVVSQISEGEIMNSAVVSAVNTELSLLGVSSADIVMTGGGPGPNSESFQFNLANIVRA
jgi:hypothetical protein